MYIGDYARSDPERVAVIVAETGERTTYAELYERSNRLARVLRAAGLRRGDHYAIFAENHLRYFEVAWAGLNSGLYVTAVNSKLTPDEAAYIVNDSGAKVVITTAGLAEVAEALTPLTPDVRLRLMIDGSTTSYDDYESAIAAESGEPLPDESRGTFMLYSSGTTGRPKGVKFPLPEHPASEGDAELLPSGMALLGLEPDDIYLSPAPLYHAAPLRTSTLVHCVGGTVVTLQKFDPEVALEAIQRYGITRSQWVPTMFVRMLKLDPAVRARYDVSSMRRAVHAAAPCPVEVKEQMIAWWGPVLFEYYSGTENIGTTALTSEEWLAHKGSVGRCHTGGMHICDDDGNEVPTGNTGLVYFETPGAEFSYHNDPGKTSSVGHPRQPTWRTLGDVGHVDADDYLYLTDRKAFMIISGGVNIYPQEIEDVLVMHPRVMDVAVFGVPHPDLGEAVKAVVQPRNWDDAGAGLERELLDYCGQHLARYKCPRSVDFERELPRLDNGKLYKRLLRDRYWGGRSSAIV